MIPKGVFVTYFTIYAIAFLLASLFYFAISIYVITESDSTTVAISFLVVTIAMIFLSIFQVFTAINQKRGYVLILIFLVPLLIAQLYFFVVSLVRWNDLLISLMEREYPQTLVTRWCYENPLAIKIMLGVGIPFYLIALVAIYNLRFGHC